MEGDRNKKYYKKSFGPLEIDKTPENRSPKQPLSPVAQNQNKCLHFS
jgi:hypothetical protein